MEFLSTYFPIIVFFCTPFTFKYHTERLFICSKKLVLVIRVLIALDIKPRVKIGIIQLEKPSNPKGGRIFNFRENTYIIRNPNQKLGVDTPINEKNFINLSAKLPFFTAPNIPSGILTIITTIIARNVTFNVTGK